MKHVASFSLFGVLVIALSALAPTVVQAQTRHFSADLTITANLTPDADPCFVLNREVGAAVSAQLGNLTWTDIEVVNFCSVEGGIGVVAQLTLTATDGSTIYGTFESEGSFTATGGIHIAGLFRFVSGTGRFEGIRGGGTIAADAPAPGSPDPVRGRLNGLYFLPRR